MCVGTIHVVALFIGDHFERQFVVIAKKKCPLASLVNRRRLRQDVDNGESVFHPQCHEHARHHREMESHMTLVPASKITDRIFGPLIRFGKQHAIAEPLIDFLTKIF